MAHKKLLLLCLAVMFAFSACKKDNSTGSAPKSTGLYVVGYTVAKNENAVATYWKNGVATLLMDSTASSSAIAIVVNGNDIYIAGTVVYPSSGAPVAVYWKNGKVVNLTTQGVESGYASAIAVNGDDVYVAGYTATNGLNFTPAYWKNGTKTALTDGSLPAQAEGIAVSNSGVYVCGSDSYGGARYWKSGTNTTLAGVRALGIVLNGNDVYISGSSKGGSTQYPTIWKNGTSTVLDSTGNGMANAMVVTGNNVYAAGYISNDQGDYGIKVNINITAGYWKNGSFTALPSSGGCSANAIAVSGNDVYVAGYNALSSSGYITTSQAVYWKNGMLITLNQNNSSANGIAFVAN